MTIMQFARRLGLYSDDKGKRDEVTTLLTSMPSNDKLTANMETKDNVSAALTATLRAGAVTAASVAAGAFTGVLDTKVNTTLADVEEDNRALQESIMSYRSQIARMDRELQFYTAAADEANLEDITNTIGAMTVSSIVDASNMASIFTLAWFQTAKLSYDGKVQVASALLERIESYAVLNIDLYSKIVKGDSEIADAISPANI